MITDITVGVCENSDFIKPRRIRYFHAGVPKAWDMVEVHDSVAIILYHEEDDVLIVVKQFRPPVFLKNGDGYVRIVCGDSR